MVRFIVCVCGCVCPTQLYWARARIALLVTPAASELHQLDVQLVQNRPVQRADSVYQLQTQRDGQNTDSESEQLLNGDKTSEVQQLRKVWKQIHIPSFS